MMSCHLQTGYECASLYSKLLKLNSIPDEALKASVLTSTDWNKDQSGDPIISRVKEIVKSGQKPSNKPLKL